MFFINFDFTSCRFFKHLFCSSNDNVGYRSFKTPKLVSITKEILKWLLIYTEKTVDGSRYCLDETHGFKRDFFTWNAQISSANVSYTMASAEDNTELTSIGSDDVDHRIAFLVVVFSVVFFRISNLIVAKFIEPPPSAINDPWRWRNLFVSWIHAILCGSWDIMW